MEHLTGPMSPLSVDDHPAIVDARRASTREALAELGGSVLLVRPVPGAGDVDPLDDDAIGRLAACWDAVGRATAEHGVRTRAARGLPVGAAPGPRARGCSTGPIPRSSGSPSTPAS